MQRMIGKLVFPLLLILCAAYLVFDGTEETNATFIRVVDGDTFIANIDGEEEYVRLLLVDTPEMNRDKAGQPQPFAKEASELMTAFFEPDQQIRIEYGAELRDRYDRALAYLYTDEGELFNELLIKEGLARVAYVFPPNDKYADSFYQAEEKARHETLGIWSIPGYTTDRGFHSP